MRRRAARRLIGALQQTRHNLQIDSHRVSRQILIPLSSDATRGGIGLAKARGAAWGRKKLQQCGALPLSAGEGQPMVLLVTTRGTGRWVIPKGWMEPELAPHALAAREAFEEAGVLGEAVEVSVGTYTYRKRMPDGRRVTCRVEVYAMRVAGFAKRFPERGQRKARWVTIDRAAELVREPELAGLLRGLALAELAVAA
jgi:8-oxo-dGTP pyrophosphatase MutT (NUDIX family)